MRNIIIGLILAAPAQAQTYPIRDYLLSGGSLTTLVEVHQDILKTYPDFDQWLLSQRRPDLRTRQLEQLQNAPRGILLTVSRVLDQELPGQPWQPGLIRSQHPQLIPKIAAAIEKQHGPQIRQFLQTYQPPAEFHTQMYERYPDLPHILKKHGI